VCVIAAPAGDLPKCGPVAGRRAGRKRALTAVVGTLAAAAVLVWVLFDRRGAFVAAIGAAPVWILVAHRLAEARHVLDSTRQTHNDGCRH